MNKTYLHTAVSVYGQEFELTLEFTETDLIKAAVALDQGEESEFVAAKVTK